MRKSVPNIRSETDNDHTDIANVITQAFAQVPISDGRETSIVEALRDDQALSVSIVAQLDQQIIGHLSCSKVHINNQFCGWYGMAPVSVLPPYQNQGIGSALIHQGLARLKQLGANGCVVLGEPSYYQRFGFASHSQLVLPDVPPAYFLAQAFHNTIPNGTVNYHPAFG
jgi:putative acetyltransferase